jgi:hypothetical protein
MTPDQQFALALVAQFVTVVLAAITAVSSARNSRKIGSLDNRVNGRMDDLMLKTEQAAMRAGYRAARKDEDERTAKVAAELKRPSQKFPRKPRTPPNTP